MNNFLQVVPQQSSKGQASGIRMSKSSTSIKTQFEGYKQELLTKPGLMLVNYCRTKGLSYESLRGYASRNHINIRNLRKGSISTTKNEAALKVSKESRQQIHVLVQIRNTSFDVSGITVDQLSTLLERMADHV